MVTVRRREAENRLGGELSRNMASSAAYAAGSRLPMGHRWRPSSSSPRASKSNAMKEADVCAASISTREFGRMDALLLRLDVQAVVGGNDDFAVNHAPFWQFRARRPLAIRESNGSSAARFGYPTPVRHGRGNISTGIRPTWARWHAPGVIDATDLANIGEPAARQSASSAHSHLSAAADPSPARVGVVPRLVAGMCLGLS